jgi:hypothetical protein
MKTVFVLLILFLVMGVFVRSYNRRTGALLVAGLAVVLLYLSLTT